MRAAQGELEELVIVGLGQLGQLFGRGALRAGMRVTPVLRETPRAVLDAVAPGTPVLVAVAEGDLAGALDTLPKRLRDDVVLVQNELFPATWQALGVTSPTGVVFWSNQKPGRPLEIGRRTALFGRHAPAMARVQRALEVPHEVLGDDAALGLELVSKYAFILAINVLGLVEARTLGEWLEADPSRVDAVVDDALRLGAARLGAPVSLDAGRAAVRDAMTRLSSMPSRGRSAPARLARARQDAARLGVELACIEALGLDGESAMQR